MVDQVKVCLVLMNIIGCRMWFPRRGKRTFKRKAQNAGNTPSNFATPVLRFLTTAFK